MLACMLISGLALAARRAVQLASYTKGFVRMFRALLCFAVAHWGFVQPFVPVPAVPLYGDCARFNRGRPAQGFPDAWYGEWQDRNSTTGYFFFASSEQQLTESWCAKCLVLNLCQFVLQFFAWFAKLQANMDQDENIKYRCGNVKIIFFTLHLDCAVTLNVMAISLFSEGRAVSKVSRKE